MDNFEVDDEGCRGCGCLAAILILNLTLGAYCFAYSADVMFGAKVPFFLALVGGLFLGELTIPVAVICWILVICGANPPLFG